MLADDADVAIQESSTEGSAGPMNAKSAVRRWWAAAGIVVLVLAAYFPAIDGDFLLSDHNVLVHNPRLTEADGLRRIWLSAEGEQYQPLTTMFFWLERPIWGLHPAGYHVVNIALHAVNAILVWWLLSRLRVRGALVAAMIFAVHPVNVESVAWIYERKNVLSGLFFFVTLVCLFRFDDKGNRAWYVAGLLLFTCALLSKASTVILPPVLLLCWWSQQRSWGLRRIAAVVPFVILAGLMAALTICYEKYRTGAEGSESATDFAERFARAGWIVVFYLSKLLLPHNLIFIYPRWSVHPAAITSYLPHLAFLAALAVLVVKRASWGRPVLFALGYYLIALFPVMGFFDVYYHRISLVADHFQYLATVGIIALCVHIVAQACDLYRRAASTTPTVGTPAGLRVLSVVAVAVCLFLTFQRSRIYENLGALSRDTLQRNPDCWFLHYKLGEHLLKTPRGQPPRQALARAVVHFKRALQIKPDDEGSLVNIAGALGTLNQPRKAVEYLHRAISVNPDNPLSHYSLGLACLQSDQVDRAIVEFEEALRLRPDMAIAHYSLGRALCRTGRLEEGIEHLGEALRINPRMSGAAAALQNARRSLRERAHD